MDFYIGYIAGLVISAVVFFFMGFMLGHRHATSGNPDTKSTSPTISKKNDMKERVTYTNIPVEDSLFDVKALLDIYGDLTAGGFISHIKILSVKKHSPDGLLEQPLTGISEAQSETIQQAIADKYCIEKTGEAYL